MIIIRAMRLHIITRMITILTDSGEANRVTAKNRKDIFLRAEHFKFQVHYHPRHVLLSTFLFHAASVFLRTSLLLRFCPCCDTVSVHSPIRASPMAMKSKHEYLFSLLTSEQKEALERVQDMLEEDPLYLEHHRKEEKENA